MIAGMILYDLVYVALATVLYGGALAAGALAGRALAEHLPWPLAVVPAVFAGLGALIVVVAVLARLLPRLRPGRYRLMTGPFFVWMAHSLLRRILFFEPLKVLIFYSAVLRFCALRALRAEVAFDASMSSDAELLDPGMLRVGAGAMIGSRCVIAGHYVEHGELVLARVEVGAGTLLSGEVGVAPGVTVGAGVTVKVRALLNPGVTIESDVVVGAAAVIGSGAVLASGARVRTGEHIAAHRRVAPTAAAASEA